MSTVALDQTADRATAGRTVSGYSVVRGLDQLPEGCTLVVENADRVRTRLHLACSLDREAAAELRDAGLRPLAVRLDLRGSTVSGCTALFTSSDGPQRLALPLPAALAFCADGLHTVVTKRG